MKSKRLKSFGLMVAVLVLIFAIGGALFFYSHTLVEWWLPPVLAAIAAQAVWLALKSVRERRWPDGARWWRWALFTALFTIVASCAILGINYAAADSDTLREETVVVERKYSEKHYRSRRVGRHRYVKGEPYYEYKVETRFADNRTKTLDMPVERYLKIPQGGTITLHLETGLFGWPVLDW